MLLHVDFFVSSIEKSLQFYVDKLGMSVVEDTELSGDLVRFVSQNKYDRYRLVMLKISSHGAMIELMQFLDEAGSPQPIITPHKGSTTILVNSLDRKVEDLRSKGLEPISDVFKIELEKLGRSRIVFYEDPDGYVIEFLEVLPKQV